MTPTPHDALFKAIYSDPQRAAAHLAVALPEEVAAALDLSTLSLAPGSYIDPELTASASDLLFEVRTRGGRAALVYLLFEHQSTVDRMMALRLLCYIVRIMERWRLDHPNAASLPLVVPLVLYHGERPWSAPLDLAELYDLGERDSDALQGHGVGLCETCRRSATKSFGRGPATRSICWCSSCSSTAVRKTSLSSSSAGRRSGRRSLRGPAFTACGMCSAILL